MIDDDRDWLEGTGLEREAGPMLGALFEGVVSLVLGLFVRRAS